MSRFIFINQVFYFQGKFLYIHVKTIYSLSMQLASCQIFFSCQFTCTIFIHLEGLVMSSGLTTGKSGNRPQEKQHGGGQFLHSQRGRLFRKYLVHFQSMHRMPGCGRWRPSCAELLSRRLEQYEGTLRVMYQRITESRHDQGVLRCDIE